MEFCEAQFCKVTHSCRHKVWQNLRDRKSDFTKLLRQTHPHWRQLVPVTVMLSMSFVWRENASKVLVGSAYILILLPVVLRNKACREEPIYVLSSSLSRGCFLTHCQSPCRHFAQDIRLMKMSQYFSVVGLEYWCPQSLATRQGLYFFCGLSFWFPNFIFILRFLLMSSKKDSAYFFDINR